MIKSSRQQFFENLNRFIADNSDVAPIDMVGELEKMKWCIMTEPGIDFFRNRKNDKEWLK